MIYTPHEVIKGRDARKGQKPRPAGEIADRGRLWICVKTGQKWAPIGHNMPDFGRPSTVLRGAKPLFSRRILRCERDFLARCARQYK
jgi:hypothetical protein